ncbi:hypothetical protein FF1_040435 [Malus domestica]
MATSMLRGSVDPLLLLKLCAGSRGHPLHGTTTSRLVLRQRCVLIFAGKQQRQCNGCVVAVQWRRCRATRMQWRCNGCVVAVANSNGEELQ